MLFHILAIREMEFEVHINISAQALVYRTVQSNCFKNASFIKPTDDVRLTIVSCWPRDNNTHRLIVIAKPA